MKNSPRSTTFFGGLIFAALWLILATPLFAGQYVEDGSNPEYVYVKGMIHTLSLNDQSITVRPRKGPGITIFIKPETELEGVKKIEGLQVKQTIKVWYKPGQKGNEALKIVKLPDLGC